MLPLRSSAPDFPYSPFPSSACHAGKKIDGEVCWFGAKRGTFRYRYWGRWLGAGWKPYTITAMETWKLFWAFLLHHCIWSNTKTFFPRFHKVTEILVNVLRTRNAFGLALRLVFPQLWNFFLPNLNSSYKFMGTRKYKAVPFLKWTMMHTSMTSMNKGMMSINTSRMSMKTKMTSMNTGMTSMNMGITTMNTSMTSMNTAWRQRTWEWRQWIRVWRQWTRVWRQ